MGALCNDVIEKDRALTGDPLEVALVQAAREEELDLGVLRRTHALRNEFTFDNHRKRMSVVCGENDAFWIGVKGAPEAILERSIHQATEGSERPLTEADRQAFLNAAARMAAAGLRVIGFAEKREERIPLSQDEAESGLIFIGLAGLADPPRLEAKGAIEACRRAGIRLVMMTGDHPLTARAIAGQVGFDADAQLLTGPEIDLLSADELREKIGEVSLYTGISPEHKLRIVEAFRERGERVAVTGDGINDAPALAAANIGVAMGETGTDVAREAADVVLSDDNFATIVHAIEEGRTLFANLKKGVRYYLACKVALISITLVPVLLRVPAPFAPIQIILMELFMDLAASATFVTELAEANLMTLPPRDPKAPFMDRAMIGSILIPAAGLFAAVSICYLASWYGGAETVRAQTVAFVTWLLGHLFLALNLRTEREPLLRLGLFTNRSMNGWVAATAAFILITTLVPAARLVFRTAPLSASDWLLAIGTAAIGTFWIELFKWFAMGRDRDGKQNH